MILFHMLQLTAQFAEVITVAKLCAPLLCANMSIVDAAKFFNIYIKIDTLRCDVSCRNNIQYEYNVLQ